jgi:hypothetical protein
MDTRDVVRVVTGMILVRQKKLVFIYLYLGEMERKIVV